MADPTDARSTGEREPDGGPMDRVGRFVRGRSTVLETRRRRANRIRRAGPEAEKNPDLLLEPPPPDHWQRAIREYRRRQADMLEQLERLKMGDRPEFPDPPPAVNWIPIGPSVAMQGQAATRPAVSGRVARAAVAPGGNRVYAATANGGVWRSDDGGRSWRSTMDAFDLNPTALASDSLACGAIAIDQADPDRVYVGTGEGDTAFVYAIILGRGVNLSYFGVGPLRSDTGGDDWIVEPVASGSPTLAGQAFFQLAVDPNDRERVVAATTAGLYRRQYNSALDGGAGGYEWAQVETGQWCDVQVSRPSSGPTTFVAAQLGGDVFSSTDGVTWTTLGTGFPTSGTSRIVLAVRPTDPDVVYAMVATSSLFGGFQGLYRFDSGGSWRSIGSSPAVGDGQANYDLAIAVDPNDEDVIYLGGSCELISGQWSAEIHHCTVSATGSGASLSYSVTPTSIGGGAHCDLHQLVFRPGSSTELWAVTDGGLFRATNAGSSATFVQRNVGLQTFSMNHFGQHPSEPAVIFGGAQDNGTLRYVGEECWLHSASGDGGYSVVNWNDPYKSLRTFTGISVRRTTDGGQGYGSWSLASPPNTGALFYGPLVGCPETTTAADAEIAAAGSGVVWLTTDFGSSWRALPSNGTTAAAGDGLAATCSALAFASATRLFAATVAGDVYRFDRSGPNWTRTKIDTGAGTNLPLAGWITDIAVDLADSTGASIYVTFGGNGDWRHVWHFDGTDWTARSGSASGAGDAVLNVHHNAIVVDPDNTSHVYAGADIGVWRSTDGGQNWSVYSQGLPDAAVIDLKIHPDSRLIRASTHGRSMWERELDATAKDGVELYVRDTTLDLGRVPTVNFLDDPTAQGSTVRHYKGPNIIVDVPSSAGAYQTTTTDLDFYQFNDDIVDGSGGVATVDPASGTVINRVYVEVHNRGVLTADNVQVMLLLGDASGGLPDLPPNYDDSVRNGTAISTGDWETVGFVTLNDVRVGAPKIAYFALPSTMLPPPASLAGNTHQCLLALLHSPDDGWVGTNVSVDPLSIGDRKSAHKNLHVVEFTGTIPGVAGAGGIAPSMQWAAVRLHGSNRRDTITDLVLHHGGYPGRASLVLPSNVKLENRREALRHWESVRGRTVKSWSEQTQRYLAESLEHGRFNPRWTKERLVAVRRAARSPELRPKDKEGPTTLPGVVIPKGQSVTVFVALGRPGRAKIGDCFEVGIEQVDRRSRRGTGGGSVWQVQVVPEPDRRADGLGIVHEIITRRRRRYLAVRLLGARNKLLTSGRGAAVQAFPNAQRVPLGGSLDLEFDDRLGAFLLPLDQLRKDEPAATSVTLSATRRGLSARITIALD